jgi:Tetratricopeptide repeat
MGLLRWLFDGGRKKTSLHNGAPVAPKAGQPSRRLTVEEAEIASVAAIARRADSLLSARSPDGRYALGWLDRNFGDGGRPGTWVLLWDGQVAAHGHMVSPNAGKVANNGNFILNDCGRLDTLSGVFCAFCADGSPILKQAFKANLHSNGISADGSLAVCQTCNSDHESDSSMLAVFDLHARKELARWVPESGWALSYEFPEGERTVRLVYPDRSAYKYTLDGNFLDTRRYLDDSLARGHVWLADALLKGAGSNPEPELRAKAIASADVALAGADTRFHALALKVRGICLESAGDFEDALACYDRALAADPKIGVKRRADQIRKRLE